MPYSKETLAMLREDPKWLKKQSKRVAIRATKNTIKNKKKAIEYTGGLNCHNPDCNHNPEYLHHVDFHHVLEEKKSDNFQHLFRHCSWERVKAEIDNCEAIPLCAMCHRDVTKEKRKVDYLNNVPIPLNTPEELE